MPRIRGRAAAAALLALSAPPALGCQLSLSGPVTQQSLTYNPFQAGASAADVSFTVKNAGAKACDAVFAFFRLGAPEARAGEGAGLSYRMLAGSGPAMQNMAAAPGWLSGAGAAAALTVGAGETFTVHATLSVPDGQVVPPGAYTDQVVLGLYRSAQGALVKAADAPLTIAITVPSQTTLTVAGGGRRTTVNFGDFVDGAVRSVNLLAWSNQGFRLVLRSDNEGAMRPVDSVARSEGQWLVPYKVAVNRGTPVDLSQRQTIAFGQATAKAGLAIPIDVQIGSTKDQRAGIYRDVITVAIDPRP